MRSLTKLILTGCTLLLLIQVSLAHAFVDHAEPAVGSQIHSAPIQVKIWFTEKLEPALSKIQVFDSSGQEIDKRDVKIDQSNGVLLTVSLPALKPGKYKVVWRAVSVDTHVTTGNFMFELV
jgi:methionine-rich copper-binding protein CopC